jgi:hypothetical protein
MLRILGRESFLAFVAGIIKFILICEKKREKKKRNVILKQPST